MTAVVALKCGTYYITRVPFHVYIVSFSDKTGCNMSTIRAQFCGKVAPQKSSPHGVPPAHFPAQQAKRSVDQSAQLVLHWKKVCTLPCRKITGVHPVVSFPPFLFNSFSFSVLWIADAGANFWSPERCRRERKDNVIAITW